MVTRNQLDKRQSDNFKINEFREKYSRSRQYFRRELIFNIDQTGINLEQSTDRTLSHQGERDTILTAQSRNKQPHSYTAQPVITRSGHIAGKIALLFKEDRGEFGPRVASKIKQLEAEYSNIQVYAGTSSVITNEIQHHWCEDVLLDLIRACDRRSAEEDSDRPPLDSSALMRGYDQGMDDGDRECWQESHDSHNCDSLTWPKTVYYTTSDLQPLDVIFNRQYKIFINRITEQAHYDEILGQITSREGIMNMHS